MNAIRKLIYKFIPSRSVVTAGQIAIDMTLQGYDQKTLSEFLHRFEEVMTGEELAR